MWAKPVKCRPLSQTLSETWLGNLVRIPRNSAIIPIPDLLPLQNVDLNFIFLIVQTCSRQLGMRSRCFIILFHHQFFQFYALKKDPVIFDSIKKQGSTHTPVLTSWLFFLPKKSSTCLTWQSSKASRCNFGIMIILPAKITSACFTWLSKWASRCNFGGKRYGDFWHWPWSMCIKLLYMLRNQYSIAQNEMCWVPTWTNY